MLHAVYRMKSTRRMVRKRARFSQPGPTCVAAGGAGLSRGCAPGAMPRAFDASAEFPVDAAQFLKDSTSAAFKAHQLRRLGNPDPAVVLSDTRRNGWHVTVRARSRLLSTAPGATLTRDVTR